MKTTGNDFVRNWWPAPAWIAFFLIVAGIIGDVTRAQIPLWYRDLVKPALNPPDFVFPVVWTALYIMIAIVGYRMWRLRGLYGGKCLNTLFALQTLMNWAWSYLFFYYHLLGFSFAWIVGLDIAVAALIFMTRKKDRTSALLLTPYFVWICFASYLNFMIWQLN